MATPACCSGPERRASIASKAVPGGVNGPDLQAAAGNSCNSLAASPLLASGAIAGEVPAVPNRPTDPVLWAPLQTDRLIKSPKEAINVFDFEAPCRVNVPPAHFGYMASGIDDEVTLRANRERTPEISIEATHCWSARRQGARRAPTSRLSA